jgi:hypothetical protein
MGRSSRYLSWPGHCAGPPLRNVAVCSHLAKSYVCSLTVEAACQAYTLVAMLAMLTTEA